MYGILTYFWLIFSLFMSGKYAMTMDGLGKWLNIYALTEIQAANPRG